MTFFKRKINKTYIEPKYDDIVGQTAGKLAEPLGVNDGKKKIDCSGH